MRIKRIGKAYVLAPAKESLSKVPFHHNFSEIERVLIMGAKLCPSAPIHIAVHKVSFSLKKKEALTWRYTEPHKHDFDEINVIWSETGLLEYRFEIDDQVQKVKSPAAVLIPAGVVHRAEAIKGQGSFFCILLNPGNKSV